MAITLSDETRSELIAALKSYFLEERGEEIGDLHATLFLDFIVEEIGPSIFNHAVKEAQARLQNVVADLDVNLFEPEFQYSAAKARRR